MGRLALLRADFDVSHGFILVPVTSVPVAAGCLHGGASGVAVAILNLVLCIAIHFLNLFLLASLPFAWFRVHLPVRILLSDVSLGTVVGQAVD